MLVGVHTSSRLHPNFQLQRFCLEVLACKTLHRNVWCMCEVYTFIQPAGYVTIARRVDGRDVEERVADTSRWPFFVYVARTFNADDSLKKHCLSLNGSIPGRSRKVGAER